MDTPRPQSAAGPTVDELTPKNARFPHPITLTRHAHLGLVCRRLVQPLVMVPNWAQLDDDNDNPAAFMTRLGSYVARWSGASTRGRPIRPPDGIASDDALDDGFPLTVAHGEAKPAAVLAACPVTDRRTRPAAPPARAAGVDDP